MANKIVGTNGQPLEMKVEAAISTKQRPFSQNSLALRGDADIIEAADIVAKRARALYNNDALTRTIIDTKVRNVTAGGFIPSPKTTDKKGNLLEDFNSELREAFLEWSEGTPELSETLDFTQLISQVERDALRSGDAFLKRVVRGDTIQFEFIESQRVPFFTDVVNNNIYRGGVRSTQYGKAVSYLILKDIYINDHFDFGLNKDYVQVSADRMTSRVMTTEGSQHRGLSILAPVMGELKDIKDVDQNIRLSLKYATAAVMNIILPEAEEQESGLGIEDGQEQDLEMLESLTVSPGSINFLPSGSQIHDFKSQFPAKSLDDYVKTKLENIAATVGIGYSELSGSFQGSYSSRRAESNVSHSNALEQRDDLIRDVIRPVYKQVISHLIEKGKIEVPASINLKSLFKTTFNVLKPQTVDLFADQRALIEVYKNGIISLETIQTAAGYDPSFENKKLAQEGQKFGGSEDPQRESVATKSPTHDQDSGQEGANPDQPDYEP